MRITKNNIEDVFKSKVKDIEEVITAGYEYIENCFVDSSGFGQENEPAMTKEQFLKRLNELLNEHQIIYTYITNVGQFQVNLGIYIKK